MPLACTPTAKGQRSAHIDCPKGCVEGQTLTVDVCPCGKQAVLCSLHPQSFCGLVAWPFGQEVENEKIEISVVHARTGLKQKVRHIEASDPTVQSIPRQVSRTKVARCQEAQHAVCQGLDENFACSKPQSSWTKQN